MENSIGQVVMSKMGHDKGLYFIVIKCEGNFVYLVDGKSRLLEKPKKKKIKHVQSVNYINYNINRKIENAEKLLDSEVREALDKYKNKDAKGE